MKIRCGSHQQNRSIVRPGLSLMATKVALTAEEFRENSQRSIDLFNTEKLSTNSTHVRKKCILQFCAFLPLQSARSVWRQRLCEAGFRYSLPLQSARSVWRQRCTSISSVLLINRCNLHGACGGKDADISLHFSFPRCNLHGACGGKVVLLGAYNTFYTLQSARGVWKTLHHPPEKNPRKFMQTYCIFIHLGV